MRDQQMKGLKYFVLALALLTMVFAANGQAALTQLGFLVDSSGSIGQDNFNQIRSGMSNAFSSVLKPDGKVEISVVVFSTNAQVVVSPPRVIDSPQAITDVATTVAGMPYLNGQTDLPEGLRLLTSEIKLGNYEPTNLDNPIIYNIVTDGLPQDTADSVTARNEAIADGVDQISAEYIAGPVQGFDFLKDQIMYPQPAAVAPPFPTTDVGFIIPVATFDEFELAFTEKLGEIVNGVDDIPEPTSFLVFAGLGLLGIGYRRLRR
jgi:uncharacterized protein YegL